jgi:hypothetical protein
MTRADFLSHPDRDAAGMRGWFEAYVSLEQTHGGKYRKEGRGRWRAPLGEATDRGAWWPPMALTPRRRERSTVSRTGDSPSSGVSIVAEGLKFEERGTGRLDYDKAALGGAVSGAPVGALLGFAFGLYGPVETFVSDLIMALWGLVFGVLIGAVGAIFGVVSHALAHGRRNLPVGTLRADRYEVVADAEVAESAARRLSEAR